MFIYEDELKDELNLYENALQSALTIEENLSRFPKIVTFNSCVTKAGSKYTFYTLSTEDTEYLDVSDEKHMFKLHRYFKKKTELKARDAYLCLRERPVSVDGELITTYSLSYVSMDEIIKIAALHS